MRLFDLEPAAATAARFVRRFERLGHDAFMTAGQRVIEEILRCRAIAIYQRPALDPIGPPVEGSHDAIGVPHGETGFPIVHPFFVTAQH